MGEEETAATQSGPGSTGSDTRRRFLQALGAASAVAGVGVTSAQETTTEGDGRGTTTDGDGERTTTAEDGDQTTADDDATPILLGGRAAYWLGLAPEPIESERNPALQLRDGERYRLVWLNLDGLEHELVVEDADGEELVASDSNESVGATASVTVTASEEMAEYYCEYHPEEMRGSVELGEGFETTAADEETTPADEDDGDTTVADGEVVDVAVGPDGQYLQFVPEEVEISVGDTVRWTAESEGHNVTAKPEAATQVDIPDEAEPFATYEGSRSFMIMQVGETFEHTFTVPGTYVYVCAPHASEGMVGRVVVNE
jgi:plastocyanin